MSFAVGSTFSFTIGLASIVLAKIGIDVALYDTYEVAALLRSKLNTGRIG